MTIIQHVSKRLSENKGLDLCLDQLVDCSISTKTLIFEKDLAGIDFEMLVSEKVLKQNSEQYEIIDYSIIGHKIFFRFEKEAETGKPEEIMLHALIAKKVEGAYKSEKRIRGITSLLREVWAIGIIHANNNRNIDFVDYINSLSLEDNKDEIFAFNEGYSRVLPYLKLEVEDFFKNAIQLIKWIESDAGYNMPLSSLLAGIKKMVNKNKEYGIKLFEYISNPNDYEVTFLIPVISGLYEKIGELFFYDHLENKLSSDVFSVAIISGLSNIEKLSNNDCEIFFEVYKKANKGNDNVILNLPRLLFSILKSKDRSINPENSQTAFRYLNELLDNDNAKIIYTILHKLGLLEDHVELCQTLIIDLIKKPHFKKEYLKQLDHVLWHLKDVHFFEKVIYTISERLPFYGIHKSLPTTISALRTSFKKEFDEVLVKLLTQEKASLRYIGQDVFRNFSLSGYTFDFNILELAPLSQYKLWVSVLQDYNEPRYSLPGLLPLLKSDSDLVRESFTCKIEDITESYGGQVIEVLKKHLPQNAPESITIIERIENYSREFFLNNINIKREIKELNPLFTHNALFIDFNVKSSRVFRSQFQKGSESESSFLSMVSKVTLLKGGGWKIDGKDEISKLGRFSSSFSLPRLYFIFPEKFDYELNTDKFTDWNENDFSILQRYLENEQQ